MKINARNCVNGETWRFVPAKNYKIFKDFDCGDDDLNEFILEDAAEHKEELFAETYYFEFRDKPRRPVAFIALSNDTIEITANRQLRPIPNKLRRYRVFPAVKIGRLGVKREYQRGAVGSQLIDIIKVLFTTCNRTGCRFLVVDAYNKKDILRFYQKNDFQVLDGQDMSRDTLIMYFDLKRLVTT